MPLVQTNQAIVEINVFASDATLPAHWQTIRIMNQLKLAFRAVSKREIIKDAEQSNSNLHLTKGTTSIRTMRSNLDTEDNNSSLISSKGKRSGMTRVQGSTRAKNLTNNQQNDQSSH